MTKIIQQGKNRKERRPLPVDHPVFWCVENGQVTLMRDSSIKEQSRVSKLLQLNA